MVLIDCEGFDAVDVEDMAVVMAAMTVPELSQRKCDTNDDDKRLVVSQQLSGTGLASFSASSRPGLVALV